MSKQEFRGFVKNGRLNAVSQYNHLFHSDRLLCARERISAALQRYFAERVRPRLGSAFDASGYVVDFALCGKFDPLAIDVDEEQLMDRIRVIELNPFAPTTDGALFAWHSEGRLLAGEDPSASPFEFRLRTCAETSGPGLKAGLMDAWRTLLEQVALQVKRQALSTHHDDDDNEAKAD